MWMVLFQKADAQTNSESRIKRCFMVFLLIVEIACAFVLLDTRHRVKYGL